MKKKVSYVIILIMCSIINANSDVKDFNVFIETYTIGPSLHINFSNSKITHSYGIEFSYWQFPFGIDVGVEYENSRYRIYTEGQFGIMAGISIGPYIEVSKKYRFNRGFQTTAWLGFHDWENVGGIADFRIKWSRLPIVFSFGGFVKYGECLKNCEL